MAASVKVYDKGDFNYGLMGICKAASYTIDVLVLNSMLCSFSEDTLRETSKLKES